MPTNAKKGPAFVAWPKTLFDDIARSSMKTSAKLLVMLVYRWTRGHFNREAAELSESYLAAASHLDEKTVARILGPLLAEGVLIQLNPYTSRRGRVLAVQTDSTRWGAFTPPNRKDLLQTTTPPTGGERTPESLPRLAGESTLGGTPCPPEREAVSAGAPACAARKSPLGVSESPPRPDSETVPEVTMSPPKNKEEISRKREQRTAVADVDATPILNTPRRSKTEHS